MDFDDTLMGRLVRAYDCFAVITVGSAFDLHARSATHLQTWPEEIGRGAAEPKPPQLQRAATSDDAQRDRWLGRVMFPCTTMVTTMISAGCADLRIAMPSAAGHGAESLGLQSRIYRSATRLPFATA